MGGEGSIAGMVISLRNNANLLRKHIPIYKRRSEFIKARKVYRKSLDQTDFQKALTKSEQAERRAKVRAEIRKELFIRRIKFGVFISASLFATFLIYNNLKREIIFKKQEVFDIEVPPASESKVYDYHECMATGLALLQENKWFYAAGYFEEALKKRSGDDAAEYHLTLVHCLLCYNEGKGCNRAETLVSKMSTEHSDDNRYKILKSRYLENRN